MDRAEASAAATVFGDWTGERVPVVIGTNSGSQPLAFQNWRRFKEAFAPELIERAVRETSASLQRPVETCVDPFSGSGTTALACQFLGVTPTAIEVNPFLADLAEAKLAPVDAEQVARRLAEVLSVAPSDGPPFPGAPQTFVEPGVGGRYLFSAEVAARIASLRDAILRVPEVEIRRILRVLLGSASLDVCNATVSGKGRRYRRNWERNDFTARSVDAAFSKAVTSAVFDITRFGRRQSLSYKLVRGDARIELAELHRHDLAIFSPPYPNSFDYTDVYNIELWILGYLSSREDNRCLRHATIRSHVQIYRDMSAKNVTGRIQSATSELRSISSLWNKKIPDMIEAYFDDLSLILGNLRHNINPGGRVYIVVGDSKYAGISIPVAAALSDIALSLGFVQLSSEPFRSMRSSPQQGGRAELAETLLVLEVPQAAS